MQTRPLTISAALFPALVLTLILAGSIHGVAASDAINPSGSYALFSVNGSSLPSTLTHEGSTLTIKSGIFIINNDGTCSSKITFTLPSKEDFTREVKATYTLEGARLTMKWEGAGTTIGDVDGNTFTMNNEGMVFVYRK